MKRFIAIAKGQPEGIFLPLRALLGGLLLLQLLAACQITRTYEVAASLEPVDGLRSNIGQLLAGGMDSETLNDEGPLHLSIEQAVVLALRNNRALKVQQLNPIIAGTFEDIERAIFDPALFATVAVSRDRAEQVSAATATRFTVEGQDSRAEAAMAQRFATGTQVDVGITHAYSASDRTPDQHAARVGLSVTQALLRGADVSANLVRIHQAELATLASQYELRGFTETLVAEVESIYWDYVLARRRIEIFEDSLEIARQQQEEARRRIEVGILPETELAAVQAEVARRRQDLIDARSVRERLRLQLLQLLGFGFHSAADRIRLLEVVDEPAVPDLPMAALEDHLALALQLRPDLNEARLQVARGDLEVVQTRNGLLPRLDLFITLGKTGFADSFNRAVEDIGGPGYDLSAGLLWEYALGNRAAGALHRQAMVGRRQAIESLDNLTQLVFLDVGIAYLEVERAREQIAASAVTRQLQEEVLRAESGKFQVGQTTAVTVAQAQRDLLASQIAEIDALVAYRKAVIDLYRLEGSLLKRRAIQAPGEEPLGEAIPPSLINGENGAFP